jgi:hypothetical protein
MEDDNTNEIHSYTFYDIHLQDKSWTLADWTL